MARPINGNVSVGIPELSFDETAMVASATLLTCGRFRVRALAVEAGCMTWFPDSGWRACVSFRIPAACACAVTTTSCETSARVNAEDAEIPLRLCEDAAGDGPVSTSTAASCATKD